MESEGRGRFPAPGGIPARASDGPCPFQPPLVHEGRRTGPSSRAGSRCRAAPLHSEKGMAKPSWQAYGAPKAYVNVSGPPAPRSREAGVQVARISRDAAPLPRPGWRVRPGSTSFIGAKRVRTSRCAPRERARRTTRARSRRMRVPPERLRRHAQPRPEHGLAAPGSSARRPRVRRACGVLHTRPPASEADPTGSRRSRTRHAASPRRPGSRCRRAPACWSPRCS